MDYTISIFLDTRRKLKTGLYPCKLRVYSATLKKAKLYPTVFEFSKNDFNSIWETSKPRKIYKETRLELQAVENKANATAKEIKPFSFEDFEKKLYRKSNESENVFHHYEEIIDKNKKAGRLGTADIYQLSMKSIKSFLLTSKGKEPIRLKFNEINPAFLKDYESFMINDKERSRTTVAIYLRHLRAVFNEAIRENEIPSDVYPFGRNKYKIPSIRSVKKSLTKEQLKTLFEAEPQTTEQKKAKDFWFFSYACNGMNIKDIANLRFENLDLNNETLVYYRAKTINTSDELVPIFVYLNDFSISIIEKYSNPEKGKTKLIFSILNDKQSEFQKQRAIKNFTRFVNQNLKKLAVSVGLPDDISSYWARHSFATNLIRSGASMEFASEALNHSDLKTTKRYFSGFEEETKKAILKNLMDF